MAATHPSTRQNPPPNLWGEVRESWSAAPYRLDRTVIEDYPEDVRGHSCLLLGHSADRRPIHVVCAPKDEYLAIVTAYLPSPEEWHADFRTRRRP